MAIINAGPAERRNDLNLYLTAFFFALLRMVILSAKCHANQCETFRRATSRPVVEAIRRPVGGNGGRTAAAAGFDGEIHVHLHNVVTQNPRELARMVGEAVKAEMNKLARTGRASFLDSD